MTAPVALQILTTMKIIMGEDGTNEGVCVCVCVYVSCYFLSLSLGQRRVAQLKENTRYNMIMKS